MAVRRHVEGCPARQAVSVAGYVLITLEPNGYNSTQSESFSNIYKGIHNWSSQPDLNYTTMYDRLIRSEHKAGKNMLVAKMY